LKNSAENARNPAAYHFDLETTIVLDAPTFLENPTVFKLGKPTVLNVVPVLVSS
jgi:hypothetical protein